MKYPKSCRQCRQSKRKCTRKGPGEPCDTCQQRRLRCDGQMRSHSAASAPLTPSVPWKDPRSSRTQAHSEEETLPGLSRGIIVELVGHYLRAIHDKSHSLFHPPTLHSQVQNGTIGKALLYAICAIGSKFSANPEARALGPCLAAKSKQLLLADLENICLENLQTCILVATLCAGNCTRGTEALFLRIAHSMADIIDLDTPTPGDTIIVSECKRRTWWSLFYSDRWCVYGLGLPSQMRDPPATFSLPMNEKMFHNLRPDIDIMDGPWQPGLWAQKLALVRFFIPILELNRLAAKHKTSTAECELEVETLAQKLKNWEDSLPYYAQMNLGNLHRQQEKGMGGVLLTLHLVYHHYSILLFFRFLEDQKTDSTVSRAYATRCKSHATMFNSLLRQSRQLKACEAVYPVVGHMVTVASAVLLHTLLFGDLEESRAARQELEENFEALLELTQYWPSVSKMIKRLNRFQNMCLLSTDSRPHQLDGWMVRFLIERAISLTDRHLDATPTMPELDSEVISSKAREFSQLGRFMNFKDS
ncbi:unnamed protein product [Clonostachys byssicola]|uniref:Zn(2)-C6 fungal-type domain-containing protein n=1 Tax=Clonostachys byssicola TaxID=160290 RepID=A0A9N9UMY7_9HYPO|nr:unnamed protein product [Clonostachys byssicola]